MKELLGLLGASSNRAIGYCLGVLVAAGQLKAKDVGFHWTGVFIATTKDGVTVSLEGEDRVEVFKLDAAGQYQEPKKERRPAKSTAKKTASKKPD